MAGRRAALMPAYASKTPGPLECRSRERDAGGATCKRRSCAAPTPPRVPTHLGYPVCLSAGQPAGSPRMGCMPWCFIRMPPVAGLDGSMRSNSGRVCAITSHAREQQLRARVRRAGGRGAGRGREWRCWLAGWCARRTPSAVVCEHRGTRPCRSHPPGAPRPTPSSPRRHDATTSSRALPVTSALRRPPPTQRAGWSPEVAPDAAACRCVAGLTCSSPGTRGPGSRACCSRRT